MKSNKLWAIVIGAFLLVCILAVLWIFRLASPGEYAVVSLNGEIIHRLDLGQEQEIRVEAADGGYNLIKIKDGAIAVTEADCPDKVCVHLGYVSDDSVPIVCLPHRLIIQVEAEGEADARSQ